MMNCCGFTLVQGVSESAQVIVLKCYSLYGYIADMMMAAESVTAWRILLPVTDSAKVMSCWTLKMFAF